MKHDSGLHIIFLIVSACGIPLNRMVNDLTTDRELALCTLARASVIGSSAVGALYCVCAAT